MPPSGDESSSAGFEIASHLPAYVRSAQRGRAYPDVTGPQVILPHRKALNPDAAYHDRALSKHGRT